MEVLDEGQFLFTDFLNVHYKAEIKIHLNYDRVPSASSGRQLLKMSSMLHKIPNRKAW